ncbi:unnamed protein product [Amoebophrya sp. A120]|nr:unnamed protein product [Amoebophrya sp. A120]|eukprot:GSA120T00013413001.1
MATVNPFVSGPTEMGDDPDAMILMSSTEQFQLQPKKKTSDFADRSCDLPTLLVDTEPDVDPELAALERGKSQSSNCNSNGDVLGKDLQVPEKYLSLLLGPEEQTLTKIKKHTSTEIHISNCENGYATAHISGNCEGVDHAVAVIHKMVTSCAQETRAPSQRTEPRLVHEVSPQFERMPGLEFLAEDKNDHDAGDQHLQEDEDIAQQDLVERHQLEEVDEDPVDQIGRQHEQLLGSAQLLQDDARSTADECDTSNDPHIMFNNHSNNSMSTENMNSTSSGQNSSGTPTSHLVHTTGGPPPSTNGPVSGGGGQELGAPPLAPGAPGLVPGAPAPGTTTTTSTGGFWSATLTTAGTTVGNSSSSCSPSLPPASNSSSSPSLQQPGLYHQQLGPAGGAAQAHHMRGGGGGPPPLPGAGAAPGGAQHLHAQQHQHAGAAGGGTTAGIPHQQHQLQQHHHQQQFNTTPGAGGPGPGTGAPGGAPPPHLHVAQHQGGQPQHPPPPTTHHHQHQQQPLLQPHHCATPGNGPASSSSGPRNSGAGVSFPPPPLGSCSAATSGAPATTTTPTVMQQPGSGGGGAGGAQHPQGGPPHQHQHHVTNMPPRGQPLSFRDRDNAAAATAGGISLRELRDREMRDRELQMRDRELLSFRDRAELMRDREMELRDRELRELEQLHLQRERDRELMAGATAGGQHHQQHLPPLHQRGGPADHQFFPRDSRDQQHSDFLMHRDQREHHQLPPFSSKYEHSHPYSRAGAPGGPPLVHPGSSSCAGGAGGGQHPPGGGGPPQHAPPPSHHHPYQSGGRGPPGEKPLPSFLEQARKHHNCHDWFEVPQKYLGLLIGRNGDAIRRYRQFATERGMNIIVDQPQKMALSRSAMQVNGGHLTQADLERMGPGTVHITGNDLANIISLKADMQQNLFKAISTLDTQKGGGGSGGGFSSFGSSFGSSGGPGGGGGFHNASTTNPLHSGGFAIGSGPSFLNGPSFRGPRGGGRDPHLRDQHRDHFPFGPSSGSSFGGGPDFGDPRAGPPIGLDPRNYAVAQSQLFSGRSRTATGTTDGDRRGNPGGVGAGGAPPMRQQNGTGGSHHNVNVGGVAPSRGGMLNNPNPMGASAPGVPSRSGPYGTNSMGKAAAPGVGGGPPSHGGGSSLFAGPSPASSTAVPTGAAPGGGFAFPQRHREDEDVGNAIARLLNTKENNKEHPDQDYDVFMTACHWNPPRAAKSESGEAVAVRRTTTTSNLMY